GDADCEDALRALLGDDDRRFEATEVRVQVTVPADRDGMSAHGVANEAEGRRQFRQRYGEQRWRGEPRGCARDPIETDAECRDAAVVRRVFGGWLVRRREQASDQLRHVLL